MNFLNSDDYLENEALEKIKEEIIQNSYLHGVFYGITRVINAQHEEIRLFRNNHHFLHEGTINHQACYFHRTLFEKYGLFDESYKICSDYKYLLMLYKANEPFYPINVIVVNYFSDGVSKLQSNLLIEEKDRLNVELGFASKSSLKKARFQRKILFYTNNTVLFLLHSMNKIYKILFFRKF